MGRSRARRAMMKSLTTKIGDFTHTSRKTVVKDYLPYIRIMLERKLHESVSGLELEKDDVSMIRGS